MTLFLFCDARASSALTNMFRIWLSGPPQAKDKVVRKIGNVGDNLRLQCPIVGYPTPFFEWKKVGFNLAYDLRGYI